MNEHAKQTRTSVQNQALQRVSVFCECTWGLGLLQKESTYCTILFSFLLLGFGLLRWETKRALVFEIQTFHSFFFSPIEFPRLYFTSRHSRHYPAASAWFEGCLSSHYQLPKNQLSSLPDDKATPSLKPPENSYVFTKENAHFQILKILS